MPLPGGLVVKKGSKICARVVGSIPQPLSLTSSSIQRRPLSSRSTRRLAILRVPWPSIASLALTARLTITCLIWFGSARMCWVPTSGRSSSSCTRSPSVRRSSWEISATSAGKSTAWISRPLFAAEGQELRGQGGGLRAGLADLGDPLAQRVGGAHAQLDQLAVAVDRGQQV